MAGRLESLRAEIRRHDNLYYVYGQPEISDLEYDKLFQQLRTLEEKHPDLVTPDSPTQRVGGEPVEGLVTVEHAVPMMSVDNSFDLQGVDDFVDKCRKKLGHEPRFTVDWKIDGCAIGLIYENGVLQRAVTRGDGKSGDDITHNARVIRGLPLNLNCDGNAGTQYSFDPIDLPGTLDIRGEAYIPNSVFKQVVAAQEKAGEEPFKNSRNATAGALRQLDPKECRNRRVHFVAHGIGQCDFMPNFDYGVLMNRLRLQGLPSIKFSGLGLGRHNIRPQIDQMIKIMDRIDYPVDGIVIKLQRASQRERMGQESSRFVSWAIAYKWERYEAETKIVRLETQVGKQGAITPVAYYEPVEIAETTVQKSTLFNFDEVKKLDPRVGDTVTLEKAGKIIPHLVRVHKDKRTGKPKIFHPPKKCPECGAATEKDGPILVCTNSTGCPAQLAAMLESAGDRTRMDIDGLGPVAIKAMMDAENIKDFASLWELQTDDSGAITGMTAGKSKKLLAALEGAKKQPSWRLLASLNIKHCGRTTSELLCKAVHEKDGAKCDVFERLQKHWKVTDLQALEGVGEETANSIVTWFDRTRNIKLVKRLRDAGLNMGTSDPRPAAKVDDGPLSGKSVCATGTFEHYTRDSIHEAIVSAGGAVQKGVNGKTDYLVEGADAGASKTKKAQDLGVTVLSENEFRNLVSEAATAAA